MNLGASKLILRSQGRMRPKLPGPIEDLLPDTILDIIYSYVPHTKRPRKTHSPSLQRELERIQNLELSGKSANYMKGLSEFVLNDYSSGKRVRAR